MLPLMSYTPQTPLQAIDNLLAEAGKAVENMHNELVKFKVVERTLRRMILGVGGKKYEMELGKVQNVIRGMESGIMENKERINAMEKLRVDIIKESEVKSK